MIGIGPNLACQPSQYVHRYGASLAYDFTLGTLTPTEGSEAITFTRSTTGTRRNASGAIETCAINQPRFDYDPTTLLCLGLLTEEQRTNLILHSEDFTINTFADSCTISANTTTAPDGAVTMDTLVSTVTGGSNNAYVDITFACSTNTDYTFSVFAKAGTSPTTAVNLWFSGGTFTQGYGVVTWAGTPSFSVTSGTGLLENEGGGIYRMQITKNSGNNTTATCRVYIRSNGTANVSGETSIVWGRKAEAGSSATSYTPTVASQATRAADIALVNNITPWFNPLAGTLEVGYDLLQGPTTTSRMLVDIGDGTGANLIRLFLNATAPFVSGNSLNASVNPGRIDSGSSGVVVGTTYKAAMAFAANDRAISAQGLAASTSTATAPMPAVTTMGIGCECTGTSQMSGHIKYLRYSPFRRPNADFPSITA